MGLLLVAGARFSALAACFAMPLAADAQSNQRISLQGSALYARLIGDAYQGFQDGTGGELQIRFTPGALSFGGGIQRTDHALAGFTNKVRLAGAFLEPRYVLAILPFARLAPYVSARMSILQQHVSEQGNTSSSTGLTANLGGGVLFRLARRVNGEAGATYGYTKFGDFTLRQPNGQTSRGPSGAGSNIVVRVGVAVGLFR